MQKKSIFAGSLKIWWKLIRRNSRKSRIRAILTNNTKYTFSLISKKPMSRVVVLCCESWSQAPIKHLCIMRKFSEICLTSKKSFYGRATNYLIYIYVHHYSLHWISSGYFLFLLVESYLGEWSFWDKSIASCPIFMLMLMVNIISVQCSI